jgi:hypothetical protein
MEFFTSPPYCIQEDAAEMSGSISFQNVGNVTGPQNYHVNNALRIRFTCIAIGAVELTVVDRTGTQQDIPLDVRVERLDQNNEWRDAPREGNKYILSWFHVYRIYVGNDVWYTLHKQTQLMVYPSAQAKDFNTVAACRSDARGR